MNIPNQLGDRKEEFIAIFERFIVQLEETSQKLHAFLDEKPERRTVEYYQKLEGNDWKVMMEEVGFLYRFCQTYFKIHIAFCERASVYPDVLNETVWGNEAHFSHDIGAAQWQNIGSYINRFIVSGEKNGARVFTIVSNIEAMLLKQIHHLKSTIYSLDPKRRENAIEEIHVIDALVQTLRSRVFYYSGIKIPGMNTAMDEENAPRATIIGDASAYLGMTNAEFTEILHIPISNAHRAISKVKNPGDQRIETTVREVHFDGADFVAVEIFNTGATVDFEKLADKLLAIRERYIEGVHPDLLLAIRAIKKNSRQVRLPLNEDLLMIDGLTITEGGSGIGLNDLHHQLEKNGGQILLNNVYAPEKGFCTTLIFPKGKNIDPDKFKNTLLLIKSLLQSGKFFLENNGEIPQREQLHG